MAPHRCSACQGRPRRFTKKVYYFDGGSVQISAQLVYELDAEGRQLRVVRITDYTQPSACARWLECRCSRAEWLQPEVRAELIEKLEARGIDLAELAQALKTNRG